MNRSTKRIIISVFSLLFILGASAIFGYYTVFQKENVTEEGIVKIYEMMNYDEVLQAIADSESITNFKHFKTVAKAMKLDKEYKHGYYIIKKGMNNKAIVRMIQFGWQTPVQITLSGYARSFEVLAKKFSSQMEADSAAFSAAINDAQRMSGYGFSKETYFGMFIPNTYEVYWTDSPEAILDRMKKEYDSFWNEERTEKAAAIGLSRNQVSTLASIVIEETKYEPEMPTIAGVYINRLKKGMLLQADPTVKFALNDPSVTRILSRHLKIQSPYNTYINKGLPPGPITIAPIVAIDAVLNYQHHNYIYFCARDTFDGQHFFATSYSEHLKNARRYQKALTARQRAKKS